MPEGFQLFAPIPGCPILSISERVLTTNLHQDMIPAIGDKYENLKVGDRHRVGEPTWGEYTLSMIRPSQEDGYIEFVYVRPQSTQEQANPKPFKSWFSQTNNVTWPPVLEPLPSGSPVDFIPDKSFPFFLNGQNSKTADRIYVNYNKRASYSGPSVIRTDLYLSPTPWPKAKFVRNVPQPQEVRWEMLGTADNLGECLHEDLVIPALGQVTLEGSPTIILPAAFPGKTLAATNFTDWAEYPLSITEEPTNDGQYLITVVTVFPPTRADLVLE